MARKDKKGRNLRAGEYYDEVNDRYVYRRMINGKHYSLTDGDLTVLRKKAANLIVEIENGSLSGRKLIEMTLDQYYECWCKNAGKSSRKATTLMNYQAYYKAHVMGTELGRVGEACALMWDAVDFSRSQVTIDKSLNRYRKKEYGFTLAVGSTKSRKGIRTITVNEAVINALMKQRQLQMQNLCPAGRILRVDDYGRVIGEIDNLVFTQANGNAWYEPAIISLIHRIVKKQNDFAEKENGKKLEYFTPHQIRHTYTTMAYEAGIDEKEVAFRLGHSSEATTRDVYTHLRGNKRQEQEEAINRIWIS